MFTPEFMKHFAGNLLAFGISVSGSVVATMVVEWWMAKASPTVMASAPPKSISAPASDPQRRVDEWRLVPNRGITPINDWSVSGQM